MKNLRIIFCLVLSLSIILSCSGCKDHDPQVKDQDIQLNDTYHGAWLSDIPYTQDAVTVSISGSIAADIKPDGLVHEAKLSICFPENFTYGNTSEQPMACYGLSCSDDQCSAAYMFVGSCANRNTSMPVPLTIYLCPQRGYAVVKFGDVSDNYVVASTDPNVDAQEILEHFAAFVQLYSNKS